MNLELAHEVVSLKSKLKQFGKESPTSSSTKDWWRNGKVAACAFTRKISCAGAAWPGNATSATYLQQNAPEEVTRANSMENSVLLQPRSAYKEAIGNESFGRLWFYHQRLALCPPKYTVCVSEHAIGILFTVSLKLSIPQPAPWKVFASRD